MDIEGTSSLLIWVAAYGYLGLFLLLFAEELGIPLPLPGDLALLFAGYLVGRGIMRFDLALATAILAVLGGASTLYLLTRVYGQPLVARFGRFLHIDPERLDRFESRSRHLGLLAVLLVRLTPGMRIYTAVLAGLTGLPYGRFLLALGPAALIWAGAFIILGSRVGERWEELYTLLEHHAILGTTAVALLLVVGAVAWRWRTSWTGRASRLLRKRSGGHQGPLRLPQ